MKKLVAHRANKRFMDVAFKSQSWQPTERNGWIIKFSIFNDDRILFVFLSGYTGQTVIREFGDEDAAVDYINLITDLDAEEWHVL